LKRIVVDQQYCKGCYLCISQCESDVLNISKNRNAKGYLVTEASDPDKCIGCMRCELICPDMAITVEDVDDEN
jgi:2-oxoglutarate ferredoxin oxidoreductase subunit delta